MSTESQLTQLIVLLNRETASGNIQWKAIQPPKSLIEGTDDVVHHFFETKYKEKLIGIYERRRRSCYNEFDFYWSTEIVLSILNKQGYIVWEYSENSQALLDLFETVKEQCSGINDLLNELLK
jgi:hypothetical protein